jgi:ribosomal protein S27AE
MKRKIECPNCGEASLAKNRLYFDIQKEKIGVEIVYECPACKVLFHEELGIRLN